jgi:heme-degrading monooxygenase HmoA
VIQVIYRWKVREGHEEAFTRAWTRGTRIIRDCFKGSHGSVLLRSRRHPSEFVGVATWESLADCQAFWRSPHPDPEAFRIVSESAAFVSREVFDELRDLERD